jgi:hypothetical protein
MHQRVASVRKLMKYTRGNMNCLPGADDLSLVSEAHLARTIHDEINLFLLLVMPRYLTSPRLQRHETHRECLRLNGRRSPNQILCLPSGRIRPSFNLAQIRNRHINISKLLGGCNSAFTLKLFAGFESENNEYDVLTTRAGDALL